jgi:hypothetical protein
MSNYKEIEIKRPSAEDTGTVVEFELDEVTEEPELSALEEPKQEKEPEPVKKPVETKKPADEPKKKESRYQKRIKQVLTEKEQMAQAAAQLKEENDALRRQMSELSKSNKTSNQEALQTTVSSLTAQLKEAIRSGEADAVVDIQDALMNAKMKLATLEAQVVSESPAPTKQATAPKAQGPQLPEKAIEWIEDHPEFNTDEEFYASAIANNNKLLREGWDVESDEFYEELSARMSKRFPEVFGVEEKSVVQSTIDTNSSDEGSSDPDVKDEQPSHQRKTEQVVSGSSRPSSPAVVSSQKKTTVRLSSTDIAQAKAWGISLEQMAKRIAHNEKNKRTDGYVPIVMERE